MRRAAALLGAVLTAALLLYVLSTPLAGLPAVGALLDPADGVFALARGAATPPAGEIAISAVEAPVRVVRDARGVPHIFADSDRDAIVALGYVVAQDRLFQINLIPRVAAGRLAEILGPGLVDTDAFMRSTGMLWGARNNLAAVREEGGPELDVLEWYAAGVNAYLDDLDPSEMPLEFRLLGFEPERFTPLHSVLVLQYMNYDLSYSSDDADYGRLRERLGDEAFELLYPKAPARAVPIIPSDALAAPSTAAADARPAPRTPRGSGLLASRAERQRAARATLAEGFVEGKGSNNWAVAPARSTTGGALLGGDMHLQLTLPAIWYEVHLVTPEMNTYGVTVPGAPLPVEAFTPALGWAFTNTGADQIDHYALELDESGERYRWEGGWRPFEFVLDTLHVAGSEPVVDTLRLSHHGPVVAREGRQAVALRWTAHERSRTLRALWEMNHATDYAAFERALRYWDTPMQNILYADTAGVVAIRSTGYLPTRGVESAHGLLDGADGASGWTGRVPFEGLPHALDPASGFLTSTNQLPAAEPYPYYLGADWRSTFRSIRIDSLLRGREAHSPDDFLRYQADVHAVQADLLRPLIDTLSGVPPRAERLRALLVDWDSKMDIDSPEALGFDVVVERLKALAWDEPAFRGLKRPSTATLLDVLHDAPETRWLDVVATGPQEDAAALLRLALTAASDSLDARHGGDPSAWRWGDHHGLTLRHLTRSQALRPLWRGPLEYPGYAETLSPARGREATASGSWRVVLDFSTSPPQAWGIYPGGQSGNPFSPLYDAHVDDFVGFRAYRLRMPETPEALGDDAHELRLAPYPTD